MTIRGLFLCDGPSDAALDSQLESLCASAGHDVEISTPDLSRLNPAPGLQIQPRIEAAMGLVESCDILFVHRDSELPDGAPRYAEVAAAAAACQLAFPTVAVVPVRMTEAWLLLDEQQIRSVAGNPKGTSPLGLPAHPEAVADPKALLQGALVAASDHTGRRLKTFKKRFGQHRRQLIERLDPTGPVAGLDSWARLVEHIQAALGPPGNP